MKTHRKIKTKGPEARGAQQSTNHNRKPKTIDGLQILTNHNLGDQLAAAVDGREIRANVVDITPEVAEVLLGNNEGNRPIDKRVLDAYARDMEGSNWALTGEPVIISDRGEILDGQHRLNACMTSKQPFRTLLVKGISRSEAFALMNTGKRRRFSDVLGTQGEQNTKVLQAAAKLLWTYYNGALAVTKRYPTNTELQEILRLHPDVRKYVSQVFLKSVKGPGSIMAALRYLLGVADEAKAEDFFSRLGSGAGLTEGSPILVLREKLLGNKGADKLSQLETCACVVKSWNAFLTGRKINILKFVSRGPKAEQFPKILGLQEQLSEAPRVAVAVQAQQPSQIPLDVN